MLRRDHAVGVVGGGPVSAEDWVALRQHCGTLVAADGGADAFLVEGATPAAIFGDLDSISDRAREKFADKLHLIPEQESTDFAKSMRNVTASWVLAAGFSGGRVDHALAVMNVLVTHAETVCIVLGDESLTLLCPPALSLDLPEGSDLSLFPMAPCRIESTGLEWPTAGIEFAPGGRIGTSNRVVGPVTLRPSGPAMLLILPRVALAKVIDALDGISSWEC